MVDGGRCLHSSSLVSASWATMTHASGPAHGRQLRPENALPAALGRVNGERMGRGQGERSGGRLATHKRIGPVPSQYTVSARLYVERSILAAFGVPVSLVIPPAGAVCGFD